MAKTKKTREWYGDVVVRVQLRQRISVTATGEITKEKLWDIIQKGEIFDITDEELIKYEELVSYDEQEDED